MGQKGLAYRLGFDHHTAITRRLSGQTPWTYDEICRVAKLFNLEGTAPRLHKTKEPGIPAIYNLNEVLLMLTPQDRWEILYVAGLFAEAKAKRPQTKKKAKSLLALIPKSAMPRHRA